MRILLDECLPRRLRRSLPGHDVRTAPEMGWAGMKNGDLLRKMDSQGFAVLVTADRSLRYQQKLQTSGVAVIVLVASSNRLVDLSPLMSSVQATLKRFSKGNCRNHRIACLGCLSRRSPEVRPLAWDRLAQLELRSYLIVCVERDA